jgi:ABC-2 type transport system ATP-binding protein
LLLECSGLSKSYGDVDALKGVSFSLSKGLSLILGPNGSGKTTLLKILSGLIPPDKGNISLFGRPYRDYPSHNISFSVEKTVMSPRIRVREYLEAVAEYRGEDNVDELIDLFELGRYQKKKFRELSQGYKRRFLVAAAFAGNPDVVFLDEPFSNLDVLSKVELSRTFQEMKRNTNIFIVSHIIAGLKEVDSFVLLHNGRVVLNKLGEEARTIGGFRAIFEDGTIVENDVQGLSSRILNGSRLQRIEPVTPEDIIYERLTREIGASEESERTK